MANPPAVLLDELRTVALNLGLYQRPTRMLRIADELEACVAALQQERDEAKKVLDALIPDVRIMVQDHFSGLPEHRAPVFDAATRLDHLVFDDDANPRDPLCPVPGQPATEEAE